MVAHCSKRPRLWIVRLISMNQHEGTKDHLKKLNANKNSAIDTNSDNHSVQRKFSLNKKRLSFVAPGLHSLYFLYISFVFCGSLPLLFSFILMKFLQPSKAHLPTLSVGYGISAPQCLLQCSLQQRFHLVTQLKIYLILQSIL